MSRGLQYFVVGCPTPTRRRKLVVPWPMFKGCRSVAAVSGALIRTSDRITWKRVNLVSIRSIFRGPRFHEHTAWRNVNGIGVSLYRGGS